MKRRSFVKATAITGAAAGLVPALGTASALATTAKKQDTEFYELRVYHLKSQYQQQLVENYWATAAIPAYNRYGSQHIGVFTELKPEGYTRLFVLIPYRSLDAFGKMAEHLAADAEYQQNGTAYLAAPADNPAYERIESSLLKAFPHSPQMAAPTQKPRIFELRQYESATENAGKTKIKMFDEDNEAGIFKRLGFNPVFFAETLIGTQRPNLTYMITFDDMAAHDRLWKSFGSDSEWKRLSSLPQYPDKLIVSHITSTLLNPAACSQV
ncbi:hypothetical protein GCM10027037_25010 [Mucilaginibacter koreensis]